MVSNYNDEDSSDLIGQAEICLTEIMMADKQQKTLTLILPEGEKSNKKIKNRNNRGQLIVKAGKIKKTEDIIKFQISAQLKSRRFLCFKNDTPYVLISKALQADIPDEFVKVY